MATDIKSIKRLKLLRRIGLIGLIASSFTIVVFLLLSFLPKGDNAFTISIDKTSSPETSSHFKASMNANGDNPIGEGAKYSVKSISNAKTTETAKVVEYIDKLALEETGTFQGSQNYNSDNDDSDGKDKYDLALVCTVFLNNISETVDQYLYYSVKLDGYTAPENGASSPLDYLRVMTRYSVKESGTSSYSKPIDTFYGKERSNFWMQKYDTENGPDDTREPISSNNFNYVKVIEEGQEVEKAVLAKDFVNNNTADGNPEGYCISFDNAVASQDLVAPKMVVIPAGGTMRFTFALYFDGRDLDSNGIAPAKSSLLLSLHFGAE